jgi:predicted nuclease of predicted toxin-antitoxin system
MKFLLDQSTDGRLAVYLRKLGHDVTRIAADYPAGLLDPKILSIAYAEGRILITDDRDFGEWVFPPQTSPCRRHFPSAWHLRAAGVKD